MEYLSERKVFKRKEYSNATSERVEKIKFMQEERIGKRVCSLVGHGSGTVSYISPVRENRRLPKFNVIVKWDNGITKATSVTTLYLL